MKEDEKPAPREPAPRHSSYNEVAALAEIKSRLEDLERVLQRKRRAPRRSGAAGAAGATTAPGSMRP